MSKKQFEDIENKFREAAENFQPPFNREGWEKMEQLLDQDTQKKRRPAGFWKWSLLLLLITTGAGVYVYMSGSTDDVRFKNVKTVPMISKPNQQKENEKENEVAIMPDKNDKPAAPDKPANSETTAASAKTGVLKSQENNSQVTGKTSKQLSQKETAELKKNRTAKKKVSPAADLPRMNDLSTVTDQRTMDEQERRAQRYTAPKNESRLKTDEQIAGKKGVAETSASDTDGKTKDKSAESSKGNDPATDQRKDTMATAKKMPGANPTPENAVQNSIPVKAPLSRFYVTASIASDVNTVSGGSLGNVSAMYGVGLGYQLNNRFSIQTGLYAGSKQYSVDGAKGYYLQPGYWTSVNIRNIDADCYVLSVPLSIRYNAILGRRGRWYGVGGMSSYFMQKETYDYYYYYINSSALQHRKELYGDNKHLFSVFDLSIGYEHMLSRRLSIQGEPYIKMPLNGVGEGKVHLYSAGFMFGLKFRP